MVRLADPYWLLLLAAAPLPLVLDRWRPPVAWPSLDGFGGGRRRAGFLALIRALPRCLALACLAVALARPQAVAGVARVAAEGVAIVVALDHSPSMSTPDFPGEGGRVLSRLDAAKATLERFVAGRPDDLIGLVVFARHPALACPPTLDHDFLQATAAAVRPATAADFGTNLGDAMIWAMGALRETSPVRKVLVLLTDGRDNPARVTPPPTSPEAAANLAHALGIRIHAIAVGTGGPVVRAIDPVTKLEVRSEAEGPDTALLGRLAETSGGRSFVATDTGALDAVFRTIDALEKSPVRGEVRTRYRELYLPWVLAALGLLALDAWLARGRLRRVP